MNKSDITKKLIERKRAKDVLIAVHRGCGGGNIIENTISAFEIALKYGGDIIEVDVAKSTDGKLYTIHEGQEERLFFSKDNVQTLSSREIESLSYRNGNSFKVKQKVEELEAVLQHFQGDTLINLDRAWDFWDDVFELVRQRSMFDQIIVKSPVKETYLDVLEQYDVPVMYIPIVKNARELNQVLARNINTVGVEVIISSEQSDFYNLEIIKDLKKRSLLVWLNAIRLNDSTVLTLGSDDDTALLVNEDEGWGRILDMGADIIQTDWPLHLANYLQKRRLRTTS
ncbi:glycerophosphodiester phosphodiesterase [Paenibacillus sp. H1-7]|uniref:glycerophosphodiester phosphodiesterase family protein n=1 Tax=Paenibacillus sp. H1-7 TaxID=2282849 RepID=UPI001EF8B8BA|nr:glycerophosphodiester phosphodiesterase family protein [Paenibacillus sp. H1-7]ULL17208.1 glycerophosphodiester phosphodiesterase [Paenibacillus sp. H1-7]